jgi:serine/threonine-protein kinase
MGAVYEVVHIETERKRALKVMHAHFVQSPELRDRFKLEAKVAAQIDSEFIVDVFDAGVDEQTQMPFLVMELLKGEELGKRLERVNRLAPPDTVTYLWQTALALDKTHKANIVHRDLKPENLFLTQREDGPPRIKVLDFGVAKFVAETGTQAGATRSLGTPLYMSPEQFRSQKVSPASDIFALAMMAYTLLVGEPYWAEEASGDVEIIAFAMKAAVGPTEPATQRAAKRGVTLPVAFDAWFARGTATDPAQRYQTATACVMGLGEVFGLNPARITGIGSSDPLPGLAASSTQPLGSASPQGTAMGSSAPRGVTPYPSPGNTGPGRVSGYPAATVAAMPSQAGFQGTGPGFQGTGPAVEYARPVAPQKSSALPILLIGGMVVLGIGGGTALFLSKQSSAKTGSESTSEARTTATTAQTSTATATAQSTPPASATVTAAIAPSTTATATAEVTAAPTATATATAAQTSKPNVSKPPVPPPPVTTQVTKPPTKPPSSGAGYSQD